MKLINLAQPLPLNSQDPVGEIEDNAIMEVSTDGKFCGKIRRVRDQRGPGKSSPCELSPNRKNTC